MAARNKGTVMSMNPVTAASYPINSAQGDSMLQKHRAFHFWEGFTDGDIELALALGSKGHPFLAHFSMQSNDWAKREYAFATFLIIASNWSYYGMSAGWGATSFPWYEEYSKPLGPPSAAAVRVSKGKYFRDFLHLNVSLDTTTRRASVLWKSSIPQPVMPPKPPPMPPSPPTGDCTPWKCSCQGMSDYFGTVGGVGWGCAPSSAQQFWRERHCNTKTPSSCTTPPVAGCGRGRGKTHSGSCCPGCIKNLILDDAAFGAQPLKADDLA